MKPAGPGDDAVLMPQQSMPGQPALACQKNQNDCCHQQQQPAVLRDWQSAAPVAQRRGAGQQGLRAEAQAEQCAGAEQGDQQLQRCEATQREADIGMKEWLLQP